MNTTKERPIVLNAGEVNAVLAGDKTQQRVIVERNKDTHPLFGSCAWYHLWCDDLSGHRMERVSRVDHQPMQEYVSVGHCPFGKVGDRLWVQEECGDELRNRYGGAGWFTVYRATNPRAMRYEKASDSDNKTVEWRKAEIMTRKESRLLLEITDIRIERVRDITHNDSVKEAAFTFYPKQAVPPLSAFPRYWMAKNGDDAWFKNPWVWVIEFKVIKEST